jgi:hypothetical protein
MLGEVGPPPSTSVYRTQELHRFRLSFHSVAGAGILFEGLAGPMQRSIQAQSKSSGNLPSTEQSSETSVAGAMQSRRKAAISGWVLLGWLPISFKEPFAEPLNHRRLGSHM